MAVVSVNLLWEGRRGRDGVDRRREYVRVYEVITDDSNDEEEDACGAEARALGLPGNGDQHNRDPYAVVVDIAGENTSETPFRWLVTITYNTDIPRELAAESLTLDPLTGLSIPTDTAPGPPEPGGGGQPTPPTSPRDQNPINWPIVYRVTHEQTTVPATHDNQGNPIVNSAGDPFNPPVMVEKSYPVLTFVKYYAFIDLDWLESYQDTLNGEIWRGRSVRICRMIAIDWESDTVNNFAVWRVTFRVKLKRGTWNGGANDTGQGWDLRILDQGYRERISEDSDDKRKISAPRDDYGNAMPGPFPLDGLGIAARSDQTTPAYVTYRHFEEADWSELGL